ncbi:MAG: ComEC/Rec2 family competence protein [Pseudomonadota bacterium]|nr:ComEC/Rec2 family competence protein [Pseudomonadota bacterium]
MATEAGARAGAFAPQPARFASVLKSRLAAWADAETGRLALWTPVALGAGSVLYFSLKSEPPFLLSMAGLALAAAGFWAGGRFRAIFAALFLVAAGFAAADLRAASVDAPRLAGELPPREISGRLVSIEEAPKLRRLIVEVATIEGVDSAALPRRARISWRGADFDVLPGDVISLRAGLSPPPAPEAPGAFDVGRQLYFQGIGAVGYALSAPEKLDAGERGFIGALQIRIERARLAIARRITAAAPGASGAIVAAVVTGKREAIPLEAERVLQDSGLAHLLAISGLHMGLATGLIFFAVRLSLAAVEPVALRYPIKKWAAVAGLLAGFLYLLLSGGGWSARRAFIMAAIVFIAILFDRQALSLRNVAIAATAILLMTPEAVMHPGFQMSFAAVTALIAAYEWASKRADPNRSFALVDRVRRYIVGIAVTDTISAVATAPYGAYHFNQSANLGLMANIVSIPVMAFWVMPAAIVGLALMPFGLDAWAWKASAAGVDVFLSLGRTVADLPGAVVAVAQWPPAALGIITLGGLWLCLQSAPWRLAGLAALPVAALMIVSSPPPDLLVSGRGDNAGVYLREPDERSFAMFNLRRNKFSARVWMEHVGLDPYRAKPVPMERSGHCDAGGCVIEIKGIGVSLLNDPVALAEDCARARLVVAFFPVSDRKRTSCAATLVDRRAIWDRGAHAVWISRNGKIRTRTVAEIRGERPWTRTAR